MIRLRRIILALLILSTSNAFAGLPQKGQRKTDQQKSGPPASAWVEKTLASMTC